MTLPDISIPDMTLPIEIAAHIHPTVVHFAIVIPVIILLLEVYNVAAKRPSISLFSFFLLLLLVFVLLSSYLTGDVDGKNAMKLFSDEAKIELDKHKQIGIFLFYSSLGLLAFKLLFMTIRQTWGRMLFILILSVFVLGILFQSKQGGILVYKYGANIETVRTLKDSTSEITANNKKMDEHIQTLKKEISQLKEKNQVLSKSLNGLDTMKKQAEDSLTNAQKNAKSTLNHAQKDANLTVSKAQEKAEKLLNDSNITAESLLINSKKEAQEILLTANTKAKNIIKKANEQALDIVKGLKSFINKATTTTLFSDTNESNTSH